MARVDDDKANFLRGLLDNLYTSLQPVIEDTRSNRTEPSLQHIFQGRRQ